MTGTIQTPNPTIFPQMEEESLKLSLIAGVDLAKGVEVRLSADNTVNTRTGTQFPIGVVDLAGLNGANVTVQTVFSRTMKAIAKGGTIASGAFVKPNGTLNADGRPQYVACASQDFALAIVLDGGAVDTEIVLGILRTPVVVA